MKFSDLPVEVVENICSFLGEDAYVAKMVPYLRPYVKNCNKEDYVVSVYERQDFASIYLYNLFPSYKNVERCVQAVVRRENLTILGWLLARSNNKLLLMIGEQAALCGSYLVLTWAMQQGCRVSQKMVLDVVRAGNTKLYKFLHFADHRYVESFKIAALHNNLDIASCFRVEYLLGDACYYLALGGHLESLQTLSIRDSIYLNQIIHGAFSGLHRDIILHYQDQCNISNEEYLLDALSSDKTEEEKIDFLNFLDGLISLDYNQIASMGPAQQHMGIIRWCLSKGRITTSIFGAAYSGTVQDMDYLKSLGCYAPAPFLYFVAVRSGRRENLQWLKDNGCSSVPDDLTVHVLDGKTDRCPLPCLQWCHEQGLRLSPSLLQESIAREKMEVFYWLLDKVDKSDKHLLSRCFLTSIDMCNLQAFTALLTPDYLSQTREKIREKKTTCANYLILEEMEKLLC
ncbi:Ankyrin repeat-containing protein [Brazilian cedratvirus IHUMI]|uniref:Ankyrin repeat-containing protein n=1 Tax=Brazilian cedratvirus IHUMI TaxID=2126980 RepID=A0A2R8FD35_9VIRU|nr:Ankyrin repeat-containing protein [Brazilian cedratvirus IHUMI]